MRKPKRKNKTVSREYVNRKPFSVSMTIEERQSASKAEELNKCDSLSELVRRLMFEPNFRKAYKQPK